MHAGFSRYIRPGATFVDVNNPDMVAAVSADGRTLALVVRNGDTAASKGFTFDLTALASVGATADAHRTSRTENLVSLPAVADPGLELRGHGRPVLDHDLRRADAVIRSGNPRGRGVRERFDEEISRRPALPISAPALTEDGLRAQAGFQR